MAFERGTTADVDDYLRELRSHLRGLPPPEIHEIVSEIESHILELLRTPDSDASSAAAVLRRLGPPSELASLYRASQAAGWASRSTTPHHVLSAALAWMRVSIHGAWILAVVCASYFLAASFLAAAALKPFFPNRTGLWRSADGDSYSLRLGLGTAPPPGQEMLGWLLVPLGVILGGLTLWAVTRYARSTFLSVRRQISESLPGGHQGDREE